MRLDLFSPAVLADPFESYRALRQAGGVHALREGELYAVARYADVVSVLRDGETFSSSIMRDVFMGTESLLRGDHAELAERRRVLDGQLPGFANLFQERNMIAEDGEVHAAMRNLVNRGFTPRRVLALEKTAREVTEQSLAAALPRGEMELVADLAAPLPSTVIAQLLGIEPERHADFRRWSNQVINAVTGLSGGFSPEDGLQAFVEFVTHLNEVIERRRAEPREDLISVLVAAEDGEVALSQVEVLVFAFGLLIAGNETTTNLIGNAILALLDHPDQLRKVRRDPALVPALVEEALRYDGPIQMLFRRTSRDVELAGTSIPAGATVLALIGSANRDERQFREPDRFDVERQPKGHLAFGFGAHFCLGASLARLEARVALEALTQRLAGIEQVDPGPVERTPSLLLRGPRRLRLRFEERAWRPTSSAGEKGAASAVQTPGPSAG